jgi:hypothetical protein
MELLGMMGNDSQSSLKRLAFPENHRDFLLLRKLTIGMVR